MAIVFNGEVYDSTTGKVTPYTDSPSNPDFSAVNLHAVDLSSANMTGPNMDKANLKRAWQAIANNTYTIK